MTVNIERAARYPMESDAWVKTVLIGGVLTLLSVLLLPVFLLYGYFLRVLRAGMGNQTTLPEFDDWGTLFVEGLYAFVILLVYQLIPLVVFAVTAGGSFLAIATGSDTGGALGLVGLFGGALLAGLLALAFGYFGLVGVANYAQVGTLGSGFDVDVIKRVAFSREYAVPWLYGIAFLILANIVVGVLNVVPILGALVGVFVTFYALVVAARLWGKGYADALGGGL